MTNKNKQKEEFEKKFLGFNSRGIVTYSNGLAVTKYKTPVAVCNNCGDKETGKKAKGWQFGHKDCSKPNGRYIRNDADANEMLDFLDQALAQKEEEVLERVDDLLHEEPRRPGVPQKWNDGRNAGIEYAKKIINQLKQK